MNKKCGYVSLIGSSNVGKSTLLNKLIGNKISIVSPKVQTTRNIINGICIENTTQLIFVDTPGIFKAKTKLEKNMVKTAWSSFADTDFVALIVDSKRGLCDDTIMVLDYLKQHNIPAILILNKIDLIPASDLLSLTKELTDIMTFRQVFMVSALTGSGVSDMRGFFAENSPEGEWLYDADEMTTAPKKFLATEITREQIFLNLHMELPYSMAVDTELWEEKKDGSAKIHQVIYVNKDSHKMIILGAGGNMIKRISQAARQEITKCLGQKIHLFLFVKINQDWVDTAVNLG